ncbi:MAG TPA: D-glycero-beta-D-manno-heptose 1-phosphate adenylyltransferase [Bacteroidia bacterium]|nr:D-glycero-beta-D-manno-heptose 1-phosphate adenylyltransferase [Bacteroidia bacterium]
MYHKQLKQKIQSLESLLPKVKDVQERGGKVVFTNGCFDIVHPGHVDYLAQARDLGDFLVLGLNTDASVKRLNKALNRPVNDEFSRALVLAGLASVDAIVLFDEETPYELIRALKPNVLVKGDDYKPEQIAGYDIVKANGGDVITIPFLKGYSTTALIRKIRE